MSFKDQVEDLTSLSVSDTDELSQFLKDGVMDVTNRCLIARPQDSSDFMAVTAELTSNGYDLNTSEIIAVIREDGTDGQWRNCTKISPGLQYDVTDTDSLNYASKTNPVYMIAEDNQISVFPVATSDPAQNAYKIYYVNNDPQNESGIALIHSHSDIKYFPTDKVYLVVMYAGIKLLQATMGDNVIAVTSVPPDTPSLTAVSYAGLGSDEDTGSVSDVTHTVVDISGATQPSYNSGAVVGLTDGTLTVEMIDTALSITDLSINAVPPDVPTLGSSSVTINGAAPTYDNTIATTAINLVTTTIAEANNFIDSDEDVELASAKLSEVQAKINEASLRIQNELNEFNQANILFQANLQKDLRDADFDNQEDARLLQKYQIEITEYQAEVNAEVQEWQANTTKDLQVWQQTNAMALQEHSARMQDALNLFNEENVEYQAEVQEKIQQAQILNQEYLQNMQKALQIAIRDADKSQEHQVQEKIQDMQAIIADNQRKITQYQAETALYQAEVTSEVQEKSTKMQHYQSLHSQLKAEYDQVFIMAAPKQQPQ